jgi:hypothetical protein
MSWNGLCVGGGWDQQGHKMSCIDGYFVIGHLNAVNVLMAWGRCFCLRSASVPELEGTKEKKESQWEQIRGSERAECQ